MLAGQPLSVAAKLDASAVRCPAGYCATCITAPCARGIFEAWSDAPSGADMYPASRCGRPCRGPVWWSRIGSRSKPRARWHFVAPWVSRPCLTTIAPYRSLPSYAPTLPDRGRPTPPRPDPCRRRPEPSGPRRSAPSCSRVPRAPASPACVRAARRARCPVAPWDWCDA